MASPPGLLALSGGPAHPAASLFSESGSSSCQARVVVRFSRLTGSSCNLARPVVLLTRRAGPPGSLTHPVVWLLSQPGLPGRPGRPSVWRIWQSVASVGPAHPAPWLIRLARPTGPPAWFSVAHPMALLVLRLVRPPGSPGRLALPAIWTARLSGSSVRVAYLAVRTDRPTVWTDRPTVLPIRLLGSSSCQSHLSLWLTSVAGLPGCLARPAVWVIRLPVSSVSLAHPASLAGRSYLPPPQVKEGRNGGKRRSQSTIRYLVATSMDASISLKDIFVGNAKSNFAATPAVWGGPRDIFGRPVGYAAICAAPDGIAEKSFRRAIFRRSTKSVREDGCFAGRIFLKFDRNGKF